MPKAAESVEDELKASYAKELAAREAELKASYAKELAAREAELKAYYAKKLAAREAELKAYYAKELAAKEAEKQEAVAGARYSAWLWEREQMAKAVSGQCSKTAWQFPI
jgi:hypothetical protein